LRSTRTTAGSGGGSGSGSSKADDLRPVPFRLQQGDSHALDNSALVSTVTSECIKCALSLLRIDGAQCLTDMGQETVRTLDRRDSLFHQPSSKMPQWAQLWWFRVCSKFLTVQLANSKPCLGWFEPDDDWVEKKRENWQPQDAGTMFLNKFVSALVLGHPDHLPCIGERESCSCVHD
jgi:hypothetical protein